MMKALVARAPDGSGFAQGYEVEPMATCLYCKRANVPFTSVEHIFPESMGNTDLILLKGTVCDPCNNGVLAQLDNVLLRFEPVAFWRTMLGIPNKDGFVPATSFANMRLVRKAPRHIAVHLQGRGGGFRPTPQGFDLDFRGRNYTPTRCRNLARAFYKVGLGLVHLDHGRSLSLSSRYDEVRKIIQGQYPDFSGYLAFSKEAKPHPAVKAEYQFAKIADVDVTVFHMDLFGIQVLFDLERRTVDNPAFLEQHSFNVLTF